MSTIVCCNLKSRIFVEIDPEDDSGGEIDNDAQFIRLEDPESAARMSVDEEDSDDEDEEGNGDVLFV